MASDINLNSDAWCELVFEGKNKSYGAYYLRKTSSKRHLKALIIVIAVATLIVFLPILVKTVMPKKDINVEMGNVELSNLDTKQDIPEENKIKELEAPPPPEMKETTRFVPPVVVEDEKVKEDEMMKTQEELTETKAAISVADIKGATDGTGVDIADLQEHKAVVQEEKEGPIELVHVEEKPTFPGGDIELMKWLQSNIQFPTIASENGVSGKVTLKFVVGKDGTVSDVKVIKPLDPSCDREAVTKVSKMPKWIPGKQNGRPVAVYFTLPVTFKLQTQ